MELSATETQITAQERYANLRRTQILTFFFAQVFVGMGLPGLSVLIERAVRQSAQQFANSEQERSGVPLQGPFTYIQVDVGSATTIVLGLTAVVATLSVAVVASSWRPSDLAATVDIPIDVWKRSMQVASSIAATTAIFTAVVSSYDKLLLKALMLVVALVGALIASASFVGKQATTAESERELAELERMKALHEEAYEKALEATRHDFRRRIQHLDLGARQMVMRWFALLAVIAVGSFALFVLAFYGVLLLAIGWGNWRLLFQADGWEALRVWSKTFAWFLWFFLGALTIWSLTRPYPKPKGAWYRLLRWSAVLAAFLIALVYPGPSLLDSDWWPRGALALSVVLAPALLTAVLVRTSLARRWPTNVLWLSDVWRQRQATRQVTETLKIRREYLQLVDSLNRDHGPSEDSATKQSVGPIRRLIRRRQT